MPAYQYAFLKPGEIRLIRLWPGLIAAPEIEFEIFHAEKASNPEYEALSYVWGSSELTDVAFITAKPRTLSKLVKRLHLDGRQKKTTEGITSPLTHSLAVALRHLRLKNRTRVIWADAICINQANNAERSKEVLDMGAIYSQATQVLVWLGPARDDSSLALETLARIGREIDFDHQIRTGRSHAGTWTATQTDDMNALGKDIQSWVAIKHVLARDWFTRLWVFQEIVLARHAIVIIGNVSISWQSFGLGLYWIYANVGRISDLPEAPSFMSFMNLASHQIWAFLELTEGPVNEWGLLNILDITQRSSCFDPRDRLYAIRSLLRSDERKLVTPDYSKSVEEVYRDTTISWIKQYDGLDILDFCVLQDSVPALDKPSWVPDLSARGKPEQTPPNFRTSGTIKAYYSISEDRNVLGVQGTKVATICSVEFSGIARDATETEVLDVSRKLWKKQRCSSASYLAGGSTIDALVETMMCGSVKELMPVNSGIFMNLRDCHRGLEGDRDGHERLDGSEDRGASYILATYLRRSLAGRSLFTTEEGHLGVCPESAVNGDIVVAVLGCGAPLVLRLVSGDRTTYQLVGTCYVPGIMNAEALLGPLPAGWGIKYMRREGLVIVLYLNGDTTTQIDPRASALPSGWRSMSEISDEIEEIEPEDEDDVRRTWFENVETGEGAWNDPRLTPELLKARGVDIQGFNLV